MDRILEEKLDAFLEKGLELSKDLSKNDREKLIMKLLNELVEIAIKNVKETEKDLSEEDLAKRRKKIIQFIQERYKIKNTEHKKSIST